MKKLLVLSSIFLFLCSCNNDDDSQSNPTTGLNINGNSYTIVNAKAVDNFNFYSDTHAEYNFILSDGIIDVTAIPSSVFGFTTDNASFAMNLSISALGMNFVPGTYVYDLNQQLDDPNFNFFDAFTIYIDGNNDKDFIDVQDTVLYATAGTVTVSGTGPNFTLAFDVTLSNGNNFQYTYGNGFDYIDNRND
ncbi:hypothetical protein ACFS5J_09355 [Flavobacterium chuncheonense]|uniref:DUF4397 domain-containing protein n=1 Tax=Flavobacterium chuncheonense TaxID=2026653 RepID=A0ABW5YMU9_9FLAO